jgi:hypothetical protein
MVGLFTGKTVSLNKENKRKYELLADIHYYLRLFLRRDRKTKFALKIKV